MGGERVLVIEPDRDIAFVLQSLLRDEGYQADAVEPCNPTAPEQAKVGADLVVLNVYAPPGAPPSDAEILLRALEQWQIPTLCLSTEKRIASEMSSKSNVVGTVELPFDADALLEKVRAALDATRSDSSASPDHRAA